MYDRIAVQIIRGRGGKLVIFASAMCTFSTSFFLTYFIQRQENLQCCFLLENTSRDLGRVLNYNVKTRRTLFWSKNEGKCGFDIPPPLKQETKQPGLDD